LEIDACHKIIEIDSILRAYHPKLKIWSGCTGTIIKQREVSKCHNNIQVNEHKGSGV